MDLAIHALIVIGKEQLPQQLRVNTRCLEAIDRIADHYRIYQIELQCTLASLFPAQPAMFLAMIDITSPCHSAAMDYQISEKLKRIERYVSDEHYGVAYVLQMQLLEQSASATDMQIDRLLDFRAKFISATGVALEKCGMSNTPRVIQFTGQVIDIPQTQLFIPPNLVRKPRLANLIQGDPRRDLLGRSASHILYDSKVDHTLGFNVRMDDSDVLGRSTLHLACSMTGRERYVRRLDLTSVSWPGKTIIGLNPLHVAAIRGDLEVFHVAAAHGYDFFSFNTDQNLSVWRRTYLHWAARYGHVELVQFLLSELGEAFEKIYAFDIDDDTGLHLAAEYGHSDVVELILSHTGSKGFFGNIPFRGHGRTAFFSAVTGNQLEIMKLLEPFGHVDEMCHNDVGMNVTPLAEAARLGYLDCVEYLLKHEQVDVNSYDFQSTPLDLAIAKGHVQCVELMRRYGAKTFIELVDEQ